MDLPGRIEELVGPMVEAMGYDIVRVQLSGQKRLRLQIMAERRGEVDMTVSECAEVSRAVSAALDVDDPISSPYTLEVSSPGIDRPLVKVFDFERFAGFEAKVELDSPIDGRRHFKGRLEGIEGSVVKMDMDGMQVSLPFERIRKAKLVMTDALLAASAEQ